MHLPDNIILLIKERSGYDINAPKAFYSLALDIKRMTGEAIGENTLRRLMGVLDEDREPRRHTLDILARYLSYPDWQSLQKSLSNEYSHMDASLDILDTALLSVGERLELKWFPERRIIIQKSDDNTFLVTLSENSKLCEGDVISVSSIVKGFPFMASKVLREGKDLGSYIGAEESGILSFARI